MPFKMTTFVFWSGGYNAGLADFGVAEFAPSCCVYWESILRYIAALLLIPSGLFGDLGLIAVPLGLGNLAIGLVICSAYPKNSACRTPLCCVIGAVNHYRNFLSYESCSHPWRHRSSLASIASTSLATIVPNRIFLAYVD